MRAFDETHAPQRHCLAAGRRGIMNRAVKEILAVILAAAAEIFVDRIRKTKKKGAKNG